MGVVYKILGQKLQSTGADSTIYTVPASTSAVISSVFVCNQTTGNAKVRVGVVPSGGTLATTNYIICDTTVYAKSTLAPTLGLTLAAGDFLTVKTDTANVSFTVFGSEIS